ncbi:sugar ABC transporter ATP-binding protein [Mesorhizobium sp. B2-4-4]|nr:sugar ABC transporter ATP-binding protein [Mesorhizobium sp. B3-1-1]TPJ60428.1 sugar ABC transporter ATP-binding protein [Mesorhizobium sp. B2-6-7]TPJ83439.1 sugar ABC transporter ATP-binding protein [Mesorhizobium sp. B2-6-3]TPJ97499.1 sugar ABC transporter ATP-binding protein [Mesorhizobium sp. B2-5-10]TPK07248.1 sugar ABC transporter ATP-binding protein [Mesorhizobium sp. B2-5-11]TPK30213.1 sugar ABC transporter ATP-binding protein [Mesorhizobium sp. B2-5-8]TPL50853.1 sugar ABC transpor
MTAMDTPLLEVQSIRKTFPGVVALADVTFDLKAGEVHALVGENGAGKSTLLSVMNGLIAPDSGEIRIDGQPVVLSDPTVALANRLSLVHQELVLCPNLSVAQNIFLGREPAARLGRNNRAALNCMARELLDEIHVSLDPSRPVGELSLNEQQIVEICRALASRPKVLVFDEPTASLNDDQVGHLLAIIRKLKASGLGIVYVSHRLGEVLDIADRVTVLRDGRVVGTRDVADLDETALVSLMVGREHKPGQSAYKERRQGSVALETKAIGKAGVFDDISLEVRAGEVVGIAGLLGCQREAVARAIFGASSIDRGEILVHGKSVAFRSPRDAIVSGIAFMPADRKGEGLVLPMSVGDNLGLTVLRSFGRRSFLKRRRKNASANDLVRKLAIKASGLSQPASQLSGGNQQKIVIGKWIARGGDIVIAEDPTRGVDVGAKFEIWRAIQGLADEGKAVLLLTTELQEMMDACDRILVMSRGRITGHFQRKEFSAEAIAHCFVA